MSRRVLTILVLACASGCGTADSAPAAEARPTSTADRDTIMRQQRPHELVAVLGLRPGDRVADIGAGRGFLEPYLARAIGPRGRLVATDVDRDAVAALAALGPPVEARLVAADDPGLEPGGFDLVLLARVDHLLADRAAYLGRVIPALAPGGRIAIANRIDREAAVRVAVEAAGLEVVGESRALPAQFVIVVTPRASLEARR
ncbi:MAG TPA: methyltransferase [Kofleriaceae bacterium]|nr:methyltransferase [Kofleriaceae bacterium]